MQDQNQHNDELNRVNSASHQLTTFNTEFDLGLFIYIFKKNLVWILLTLSLSVVASLLYIRYSSPVFRSSALIQIEKSNKANQLLEVDDFYETKDISAEIELLRSNLIAKNAIARLPLEVSYFTQGQFLTNEIYRSSPFEVELLVKDSNLATIRIDLTFKDEYSGKLIWGDEENQEKEIEFGKVVQLPFATLRVWIKDFDRIAKDTKAVKPLTYFFVINNLADMAKEVSNKLEIEIQNISANTIKLSYSDNNRLKAKEIVSHVIKEFKFYNVEKKKQSSKQILQFLSNQITTVYDQQKSAEKEIQEFKRDNNISDVTEVSTIFVDRLNQLDEARVDLEIQLSLLDQINEKLDKDDDIDVYELLPILVGSSSEGSITTLMDGLNELLLEKQRMLYTTKEGSDPVKKVDYQIEIQKNLIIKSVNSLRMKLQDRLDGLTDKANELEEGYFDVPEQEIELLRLKRTYDINEKFYTLLLEKKTEYSISQEGFVSNVNVLDVAKISNTPISPNKELIIISFVAFGILISMLLVILKYLLHNKITSIAEIQNYSRSEVSMLGMVPKYKQDIPVSQLIVDRNPKSIIAEAFRSLRSNLQFISKDEQPKIMAVTSTVSGEGKTFIAINLGGIIAYGGKKVIILDLDMRKPKIHKGFGVENQKGMSTLLIDKDQIDQCIHRSKLENLDFITAGPVPPNPSELIINGNLDLIIDHLKKSYDLIICDNPPVGLVTDGIEVIQRADYPIYIFRAEYSKKQFVQSIDRLIRENKINKLSVVLNGVDLQKRSYGYGYGSGYGYGYGYGYGQGYYDDTSAEKQGWLSRFKRKA